MRKKTFNIGDKVYGDTFKQTAPDDRCDCGRAFWPSNGKYVAEAVGAVEDVKYLIDGDWYNHDDARTYQEARKEAKSRNVLHKKMVKKKKQAIKKREAGSYARYLEDVIASMTNGAERDYSPVGLRRRWRHGREGNPDEDHG